MTGGEDGCGYILGCITREIQQRHLERVDVWGLVACPCERVTERWTGTMTF